MKIKEEQQKEGKMGEYGTRFENCEDCPRYENCKRNVNDCILEVTFDEPLVTHRPDLFG